MRSGRGSEDVVNFGIIFADVGVHLAGTGKAAFSIREPVTGPEQDLARSREYG